MPRGGKRAGAGKPKGYFHQRTLERETVLRHFQQRVMTHADELFNAQLAKARGSIMIFRVDEKTDVSGKTRRVHTLVPDAEEIKRVLDDNEGSSGIVGEN